MTLELEVPRWPPQGMVTDLWCIPAMLPSTPVTCLPATLHGSCCPGWSQAVHIPCLPDLSCPHTFPGLGWKAGHFLHFHSLTCLILQASFAPEPPWSCLVDIGSDNAHHYCVQEDSMQAMTSERKLWGRPQNHLCVSILELPSNFSIFPTLLGVFWNGSPLTSVPSIQTKKPSITV